MKLVRRKRGDVNSLSGWRCMTRCDHPGRVGSGGVRTLRRQRASRAGRWRRRQARAGDSGKLVPLHTKFIAKTLMAGKDKHRTDLDDGCGVWAAIRKQVLRIIEGRIREPHRILVWSGCGVDYVVSLVADNLGMIPDARPEEVDVGDRPLIEVLVRFQFQSVFVIDLAQKPEESGGVVRLIRREQRHGRVSGAER